MNGASPSQQPQQITFPFDVDPESLFNLRLLVARALGLNTGTINIGGSVTIAVNLTVDGAATIDGALNVKGAIKSNGVSGLSGSVTLAKLTTGGTTGSITFSNGLITAVVSPT